MEKTSRHQGQHPLFVYARITPFLALAFSASLAFVSCQTPAENGFSPHVQLPLMSHPSGASAPGAHAPNVSAPFSLLTGDFCFYGGCSVNEYGMADLSALPPAPSPVAPAKSPSSAVTPAQQDSNDTVSESAALASQAGSLLAEKPNAATFRGKVEEIAGREIQQSLSQFGTARVRIDTDKHFSLKDSQLDLLLALNERQDHVVFTQESLHRTDNLTQSSTGLGYRWYSGDWMLGGNTFLDSDISAQYARTGLGAEYRRDNLSLSTNVYRRLTNWRQSAEQDDYHERPASGWDVRLQTWLPSLPHVGWLLDVEQYYGQETVLSGQENPRQNPHDVDARINFTPVPLLTLGAQERLEGSGLHDTWFGLELNYRPGVPWSQQVDADNVASLHSLAGSRYELVDRNDNMVMQYRKDTVIFLTTAPRVSGYPGELKSLGVSVESQHGLDRIDWSAASLEAAGGKIVKHGTQYFVRLPPRATDGDSSWMITAIATDKKGNKSDRSETQVSMQASSASVMRSTFTPKLSILPADSHSKVALSLILRDAKGAPVDIPPREVHIGVSGLKSARVSLPVKKSPGVMTITVSAGHDEEHITLSPSVQGLILPSSHVTISTDSPDASRSAFMAAPASVIADDIQGSTLTLKLKNAAGDPLGGKKEDLALVAQTASAGVSASDAVTISEIKEGPFGVYKATLKGDKTGRYTVIPLFDGKNLGNLQADVTLLAGNPVPENSGITTNKTTYTSGNTLTVTVTLKDTKGNVVSSAASLLTDTAITVPSASANGNWSDNGNGVYQRSYTARTAGSGLKAKLELQNWTQADYSSAYTVNSYSVPVSNGKDISCSTMANYLNKSADLYINLYDGHWVRNICIPGGESYNGDVVRIKSTAGYTTTIAVNNTSYTMNRGSHNNYIFRSDGNTWLPQ